MQHLLSAFFALIFSVGHAQPLHTSAAFSPAPFAAQNPEPAPSRQQVSFSSCLNGYAGSSCASSPTAATSDHASSRSRSSATSRLAFALSRR